MGLKVTDAELEATTFIVTDAVCVTEPAVREIVPLHVVPAAIPL